MGTTIDDIAKACGLSRATVSRVLCDSPRVSKKSRLLVEKVIKETGYQPNRIAQSLAQGFSDTVALIVGNISSVAQIEITKAIQKELYERRFMVWLCNSDYNTDLCDTYLDAAVSSKLAGAFLVTANASAKKMQQATDNGLPIVLVNSQEMLVSCDSILGNDQKAAHQAVSALIAKGHRNIALLTSTHMRVPSYNAYMGYCAALAEHGLPFQKNLVYEFDIRTYSDTLSPRATFDAATLFENAPDATAVIFSSNEIAVEFYMQCRKYGKDVPGDISLVSLDPVRSNWSPEIALCSYGADQNALGQAAAKQMLARIESRKKTSQKGVAFSSSTIMLEPSYLEGNSVRSLL